MVAGMGKVGAGTGGMWFFGVGGPMEGQTPDGNDREGAFPWREVPEVRLCGWKGVDKRGRGEMRSERWGWTGGP